MAAGTSDPACLLPLIRCCPMIAAQKHVLSSPSPPYCFVPVPRLMVHPPPGASQLLNTLLTTPLLHTPMHTPLSHVLAWLGEPLSSVLLSPSSNPIRATHILLVPPCSSAHGISQGRMPEQVAFATPLSTHLPREASLAPTRCPFCFHLVGSASLGSCQPPSCHCLEPASLPACSLPNGAS